MIKPSDFDTEQEAYIRLVNIFSNKMKDKFIHKMKAGYGGWELSENKEFIERLLHENVKKGFTNENLIDIANYAAMLYNLNGATDVDRS